jgi:hypothetical protein
MKAFLRITVLVCALVVALPAQNTAYLQWAQVDGVSVSVERGCGHYEFAAAVQAIAAKAGVTVPQQAIVERVYGTTDCGPVGDGVALASKVSGSYRLDDGTSFTVSASYASGAGSADAAVVPLSQGRPYIMFWKKRPMVVIAAAFNRTDSNGNLVTYSDVNGYPVIQVIRMLDPKGGGTVEWRRGTDNIGELRGTMAIIVRR